MTAFVRVIFYLFCFCTLISTTALADVPSTLNYQGTLTDSAGRPVVGDKSITFRLYSAPAGGDPFWTGTQTVAIRDGRLSVVLGANTADNPLDPKQFTGETYISLQVAPDAEMPRQRFTSVAYALSSGNSYALSSADGKLKDVVIVSNGGNVGIGVSNPSAKLEVDGPIFGTKWRDYRAFIRFFAQSGVTDANLCPEGGKATMVTGPEQSLRLLTGGDICSNSFHAEKSCVDVHQIAGCGSINTNFYPYEAEPCDKDLHGKWAPYPWSSDASTHNVTTYMLGSGIGCEGIKYACCR